LSQPEQEIQQQIDPHPGWEDDEWRKVQEIYTSTIDFVSFIQEAGTMEVHLPKDPVAEGLGKFHDLLHLTQQFKNRLSTIISSVISSKATWDTYKGRLDKIYSTRKNRLLQEPEIKNLKSDEMRKATCELRMPNVTQLLEYVEETQTYIDNVLKILRQREETLKSTNDNLSRQVSVVQQQIEIGEIPRAAFNNQH